MSKLSQTNLAAPIKLHMRNICETFYMFVLKPLASWKLHHLAQGCYPNISVLRLEKGHSIVGLMVQQELLANSKQKFFWGAQEPFLS